MLKHGKYKWTGPDQRTGVVREQVVYLLEESTINGQLHVFDDVGYAIPVDESELTPCNDGPSPILALIDLWRSARGGDA